MEAALRKVPCHRIFIAHYEHILSDPRAFLEPLAQFLELGDSEKKVIFFLSFSSLILHSSLTLTQDSETKIKQRRETSISESP